MYPVARERSSARASTEISPFSQHRRRLCSATRPISTLFAHRRKSWPNATPSPIPSQSRFPPQAACNRSTRLAGARGGGCAASPRCVRMRVMAAGSSIAAMSFSCPPQCGHCSMSTGINSGINRGSVLIETRNKGGQRQLFRRILPACPVAPASSSIGCL